MSEDLTGIPEDLREWLEQFPPGEEAIRYLEANKTDWDSVPSFVAGYLKGLFVNDIWAALEDQQLSQSDLAERLDESRQYVSKVLKEQANFTIESMAKLACALGLSLTIRLHRRDERMAIVPVSRGKKNVVKLGEPSGRAPKAAARENAAAYGRATQTRRSEAKKGCSQGAKQKPPREAGGTREK